MDSSLAYTSYKRYKADTDFVANWLAVTARRCGYVVANPPTTASPGPGRLKGKARKAAHQAVNRTNAADRNDSGYRVKIAEFEPLALCIVRCTKPRIMVPEAFRYTLDEAISTRKRFQDLYPVPDQSYAGQQDGHAHMISTLESVRKILHPIMPALVKSQTSGSTIPSEQDADSNRFRHLTLDESAESVEMHETRRDTAPTAQKFTADVGASKQEAKFAAACFYCDLHQMRQYLSSLWSDYKGRKVDLVPVSLATNTAIDVVRNLHDEFDMMFGKQLQLKDFPCYVCSPIKASGSQDDVSMHGACLFSSRVLLTRWKDLSEDTRDYVPCVSPNFMRIVPLESLGASPTEPERLVHEFNVTAGVIPEFFVLARHAPSVPAEHNLIRGLRDLFREKSIPRWLDFALQIYLDVRRILGEKVVQGFADLQREAAVILPNIEVVLLADPLVNSDKSPRSMYKSLSDVLELIRRWTSTDYIDRIRRDMQLDESISDAYPAYYLLERDPLWCGLLLYNFRIVAHEGAILTANCGRYVQATVHLYNCLNQSEATSSCWPDLEMFLRNLQDVRNVFVGERPKSIRDCAYNFALAFGASTASLKSLRRKGPVKFAFEKSRKLQISMKTLWWFKHRYCDNSGRVDVSSGDLEAIVREHSADRIKGYKLGETLTPVQLLIPLTDALCRDTELMKFDYFELHLVCLRLLQRLNEVLGPQLHDWIKLGTDERSISAFVLYLLTEAALSSSEGPPGGAVLLVAGQIVADAIAQEGDRVINKSMPLVAHEFRSALGQAHAEPDDAEERMNHRPRT